LDELKGRDHLEDEDQDEGKDKGKVPKMDHRGMRHEIVDLNSTVSRWGTTGSTFANMVINLPVSQNFFAT
jgi:hypothetical protein